MGEGTKCGVVNTYLYRNNMDVGQDIPNRNLDVWQEGELEGTSKVVEILML